MLTSQPASADGYTRPAIDALTQAASTEPDFAGWLASILATAAARLGSSDALTSRRPGSWEASLVDQLVKGTIGYHDELLPCYAQDTQPPGDPGQGGARHIETAGQSRRTPEG